MKQNQIVVVKKLKRPFKKSGNALRPGEVAELKSWGISIVNNSTETYYVDRMTPKAKRSK